MYTIEKHIIPSKGNVKYCLIPIRQMEIGDSILVLKEATKKDQINYIMGIKRLAIKYNLDYEFTSQLTKEGLRIWRIR